MPQGNGTRCFGFTSADGWIHCTREQYAGAIAQDKAGTYPHKPEGDCLCGSVHAPAKAVESPLPTATVIGRRDYVIRDQDGVAVATHRRIDYSDGSKAMPWVGKDIEPKDLLYGAESLAKTSQNAPVIVTEGEKAASALRTVAGSGMVVVATVCGASSTPSAQALAMLHGRRVWLWPDHDEPGRKHMEGVAAGLQGEVTELRVIAWGAEPKDDADDFVARGGDRAALVALCRDAGSADPSPSGPTLTQVGLGYRLEAGGVVLMLTRLKESRAEMTGELRVSIRGEHLSITRLNLTSATARRTAATVLKERTNGQGPVDWVDLLEQLVVGVLAVEHQPSPLEEVGRLPVRKEPPMMLFPLMPEASPTLIYGPGGAGKSTVAAAIAVSLAAGVEVIKGWLPRRCRIAFIDYESTKEELNDRISSIAAGVGIEAPEGIYYYPARRSLADQVEDLSGSLAERRIDVLIVDSVGLALGTTSRDGGDASESALRLFSALRLLGRTSLLIDHVKGEDLAGERAGAGRPYGSVYKMNLSRSVFELRREESSETTGTQLVLLHRKVNGGALLKPIGLYVVHEPGKIHLESCQVTAPDLERTALSVGQRMRRELRDGALSVKDITERLSCPMASVRTALHRDPRFLRLSDGRIGLAL